VSVKRNDLAIGRLTRSELSLFLARDHFVVAGAAAAGGWMTRVVTLAGAEAPFFERLLTNPDDPDIAKQLAGPATSLTLGRRTPLPAVRTFPSDPPAQEPTAPDAGP
jgi:hypothetical protein